MTATWWLVEAAILLTVLSSAFGIAHLIHKGNRELDAALRHAFNTDDVSHVHVLDDYDALRVREQLKRGQP